MSLSREEWEKMWKAIRAIESNISERHPFYTLMLANIQVIKDNIQSVLEQME